MIYDLYHIIYNLYNIYTYDLWFPAHQTTQCFIILFFTAISQNYFVLIYSDALQGLFMIVAVTCVMCAQWCFWGI